jgi:hypothetical protein
MEIAASLNLKLTARMRPRNWMVEHQGNQVILKPDKHEKRLVILQIEDASLGHDLTKLSPCLYVGGDAVACNIDSLLQHNISHVVDCSMNAGIACAAAPMAALA